MFGSTGKHYDSIQYTSRIKTLLIALGAEKQGP